MTETSSKLQLDAPRRIVTAAAAEELLTEILRAVGCSEATSQLVAAHLTEASLSGVESHGLMRVLQYVEQFESGYLKATARPRILKGESGPSEVDGDGGLGIPAMKLAVEEACCQAKASGIAALPLRNLGHTGRLGSFAEEAAEAGCMMILMGGGKRKDWRQVAPHGGRRALLPTNPYCIGIPGGDRGPVVLDFATSKIAGGWIYAARNAGARLPADALIDAEGRPTQDPEDYYRGGAILPAGGAKGYALALVAELVAEAMLGSNQDRVQLAYDRPRLCPSSPTGSHEGSGRGDPGRAACLPSGAGLSARGDPRRTRARPEGRRRRQDRRAGSDLERDLRPGGTSG